MAIDPVTAQLLAGLAQGALSGIQGANSGKQSAAQLAQQERQFAASQRQQQGQQALMATQMDPLLQQKSRQQAALVEQLMKGASSPTLNVKEGRFDGGLKYSPEMFKQISSFFTPESRQNAEAQFGLNATAASGGQYAMPNSYPGVGNMPGVGYPAPVGAGPTTPPPIPPGGPTPMPTPNPMPFFDEQEERRKRRNTPGGVTF